LGPAERPASLEVAMATAALPRLPLGPNGTHLCLYLRPQKKQKLPAAGEMQRPVSWFSLKEYIVQPVWMHSLRLVLSEKRR